ncbi:GPO family capsid scaffolding protein [Novosphingobium mathurense]|uniref:Phage capsid scaffolding protein (GPO) serine peptidase n=1 Tax=Novosphingobium mathurense TaxID=428990 RepID=A0A1U6INS1_9SPHN|nr:GPO family capsid scaffolding protein [Novosphingobium mathurense]SLK09691.1 Phage capsid scaffolding protein (GPO) serine peptidase [Novosphingobium mathurense]
MAKSKFFRVAVEGATVDGRVIQREWLEQMAASYDPATYTARINCEHIAGYSPERPFNAYGSVLSLKTEEVELTINGEKKMLLALYAEIDANDQLVEINKAGQKLFTSCEIHPDFAGEGKAYLVGLAVTDQPASLGTEPLKFAAMSRPNVFTTAHETAMELAAQPLDGEQIGESIGRSLLAFFKKDKKDEPVSPPAANAPAPANDNAFDVDKFAAVMGQQIAAASKPANDAVAALGARFDALEAKLKTTEQPGTFNRTPATGGTGSIKTDC